MYSDLKGPDETKLAIISYNKQDKPDPLKTSHIYIGPDVRIIHANIFVDNSMFSSKNYKNEGQYDPYYGEPTDITDDEYVSIFNKQLIIKGSVSARNCVGCVDREEMKQDGYHFVARGPIGPARDEEARRIAKKYDLNYLRYFSLEVIFDESTGLPIDLQCMMPLRDSDIARIEEGEQLTNPKNGKICNGINPNKSYAEGGDLAFRNRDFVDENYRTLISDKTDGIGEIWTTSRTNPVYLEFVSVPSGSFIFEQPKNIWTRLD